MPLARSVGRDTFPDRARASKMNSISMTTYRTQPHMHGWLDSQKCRFFPTISITGYRTRLGESVAFQTGQATQFRVFSMFVYRTNQMRQRSAMGMKPSNFQSFLFSFLGQMIFDSRFSIFDPGKIAALKMPIQNRESRIQNGNG